MTYLALDPGGTTGWASFQPSTVRFEWGKLATDDGDADIPGHHRALWNLLEHMHGLAYPNEYLTVICEKFNYQRRDITKGIQLELISRNYIGIVELFCKQRPKSTYLFMHELGFKTFWLKSDKIKVVGWPTSQHERDALAHLLYHLTFTLKPPDERWLRQLHPGH